MTDTINNVPRELLERASNLAFQTQHYPLHEELRTLLSAPSSANHVEDVRAMVDAPSPAGVEGLDTDRNAAFKACPESGCDWGSFYLGWKARGEVEQAIIDGLRGEVGAQRVKTCIALKERNDAREERDAALVECERRQMQLAACGVVALANTIESAGEARQMHPDYMSASCSDVAGAVDREIALRTERDQQAQRIGELASHLEFAVTMLTVAGLAGNAQVAAMRAALSAGKDSER